jgi:hypothetical protein
MKGLVTATLVLGGTILVSGCGGGGSGPASPSFDPFGTESAGASSEPAGASTEGLPGGPAEIADLCATDCQRFMACPSISGSNCLASCEAEFLAYPACAGVIQDYLACISTAAITCAASGSLDTSGCVESQEATETCIDPGTTGTGPQS